MEKKYSGVKNINNLEAQPKTNINWFPGHMKKATDEIKKTLEKVDLIIEVVDARAITVSSNSDLNQIVDQKPILQVALKSDLSDVRNSTTNNLIIGSINEKRFKSVILHKIYLMFNEKIQKARNKGLINKQFIIMVIGIPNVGKSSLINFLAPKKTLKTENRAGVTKTQATRKINEHFYLIDTPGVLVKNITNIEDGYKLALINCISHKVLPMYDLIKYCHQFFTKNYLSKMQSYFKFQISLDFDIFICDICDKYQLKTKNNINDEQRAYEMLLKLFANATITRFHF